MISDLDIKFGSDPEVFAYNSKLGVISPALLEKFSDVKRLGGDNKHPIYIDEKLFMWIGDGVAHELTLMQPYDSMVEMKRVIDDAINRLKEHISLVRFYGEKLSIRTKPVAKILPELYIPYLEDEAIFMGFIYGCDPDNDAIDPKYHCSTRDAASDLFRYAGGHLHFSSQNYSKLFKNFPKIATRLLAVSVGNFVTANTQNPKLEKQRIGVYGRPGRFRAQGPYKNGSFGVEYRTPSVSWINFSPENMEKMQELALKSLELFVEGGEYNRMNRVSKALQLLDSTVDAITNVDKKLAEENLEKFRRI